MKFFASKRLSAAIVVLALATLACNFGKPPPAATQETDLPSTQITQATQPANNDQGLCANPLYPVKVGATWAYTSTGSITGDHSFTDTITDVRDDGFTLTSQFDQLVRTQEWTCKPEGLASLTFGGGAAAGISTSGIQMDLTTSNVQGVNLPKTINAGDQWPYSLDFKGTMDLNGTSVDTQGTATYTFNAIGEENVTVPAGAFNAMKIHVEMIFDMQVTFSGINTPVKFTSSSDMWYAPDVGWVKSTGSGDIMGTSYDESIELQSYNIP
jgi:hypothetical protein